MSGAGSRAQAGVTLMELMTVVAVVGILSMIAIPTYRAYTLRANRTDAKVALLSIVDALERCYTRNNSYVDNPPNAPCPAASSMPYLVTPQDYLITVNNAPPAPHSGVNAQGFAVQAIPQGGQAEDTYCGNFTLDDANERGITGTGTASYCWSQ
jgi:type IV pilus assembly protein PilE